jgi:type IV pilus assembly protein PilC
MLFSPRVPLKTLAALCRRLSIALVAGIDMRTVWAREAEQARGRTLQRHLADISQAVNQGESLSATIAATGDFFPPLFRELTEVGEQSGHQGEVFAQLADHYQGQVAMRRAFLAAIAWPMLQLAVAVFVVGLLIWVVDFISEMTGATVDILGFGLVGNRGLAIYLAIVATAGVLLLLLIRLVSRGLVNMRPLQRIAVRLPAIGPALQSIALARLAWSMHLTMNAGMEVRKALRLSLRSTRTARYTDQIEPIEARISGGTSIYEAFNASGCFPPDFLDALHVGEESGKLVESMAGLSRQYQDHARAALATLTVFAGFAVWAMVALLIIALIFRIFMFYLGAINDAMPR